MMMMMMMMANYHGIWLQMYEDMYAIKGDINLNFKKVPG